MRCPDLEPARRRRHRAGYTLLELVVAISLAILIVGGVGALLTSSTRQVAANRVRMRAAVEQRRNLEAIANVLRDADITTLTGFDAQWKSYAPSFSQVLGAGPSARTLGEVLRLEWRPDTEVVDGVAAPGAVWLVDVAGGAERIAPRVPQNGFWVRQEGGTLIINISTYCTGEAREVAIVSNQTAVTLRN